MKKFKTGIIALLIITIIDFVISGWYVNLTESHFKTLNKFEKYDCAIVLSGDYSKEGQIGNETLRRCAHTLWLFGENWIGKIVLSGGFRPWRKETSAGQAKRWLIEHNVPPGTLYAESRSCDTISNLIHSLNLAKKLNCRKILIISSSLHLFRIEILLNDIKPPEGLEIIFEPYPIADNYPKVNFITLVSQVHHEWISFALHELLPRTWYDKLVFFLRGCS